MMDSASYKLHQMETIKKKIAAMLVSRVDVGNHDDWLIEYWNWILKIRDICMQLRGESTWIVNTGRGKWKGNTFHEVIWENDLSSSTLVKIYEISSSTSAITPISILLFWSSFNLKSN